MHIGHLQFNKVPATLFFDQLLDVAIITDKYQVTHLAVLWIHKWIQGIQHLADEDGYEEWLWIAWEYGQIEIFRRMVNRLVIEVQINSSGKCVNKKGKGFGAHLPLEILESICKARETVIGQGLVSVDNIMEKLLARRSCRESSKQCDAGALGSLILELRRINIWSQPKACEVKCSVEVLTENLKTVQILTAVSFNSHTYQDHGVCYHTKELKDSANKVTQKETMPTILLESHCNHLVAQQGKLEIDAAFTT